MRRFWSIVESVALIPESLTRAKVRKNAQLQQERLDSEGHSGSDRYADATGCDSTIVTFLRPDQFQSRRISGLWPPSNQR